MSRKLNRRQKTVLELVAKGVPLQAAFSQAGYANYPKNATVLIKRILARPDGRIYYENLIGKNALVDPLKDIYPYKDTELTEEPVKKEYRPLTHKAFLFCKLIVSGVEVGEAVYRAGYNFATIGLARNYGQHHLLNRPSIVAKINELKGKGETFRLEEIEKLQAEMPWENSPKSADRWVRQQAYDLLRIAKRENDVRLSLSLLQVIDNSLTREFRRRRANGRMAVGERAGFSKNEIKDLIIDHGLTEADKNKAKEVDRFLEELTEYDGTSSEEKGGTQ